MLIYLKGDLLSSSAQVQVNTVNTVGVMGKVIAGIHHSFHLYQAVCNIHHIVIFFRTYSRSCKGFHISVHHPWYITIKSGEPRQKEMPLGCRTLNVKIYVHHRFYFLLSTNFSLT